MGRREFQFELGIQSERHAGGDERDTLFPLLLRYGVSERFELRFETSGIDELSRAAGRTVNGYQPVSLGGKFRLGEGLGLIGRAFAPSGGGGFESDRAQGDVRLAADVALKSGFSLNPNLGFGVYTGDGGTSYGTALAALTLNFNPNPRTQFFVDAGFQSSEGTGRAAAIVDGGVTVILGRDVQLDLSAGTGISGETTPRPFVGAGVSWRFRPRR